MVRRIVIFISVLASVAYGSSVAQQSSAKPMSVTQMLKGMSANIAGISSFKVPVHIIVRVKKGMFSKRFPMDGNRYFKAPDSNALKVESGGNPDLVNALVAAFALIDSPVTWEQTRSISFQGNENVDGHTVYALLATPKRQSNVDHVVLDVDTSTFDPVRASWVFHNGGTLTMHMRQGLVNGKYRLAQHDDVDFAFPSYHGTAVLDYGTYAVNVPVADSVFSK